MNTWESFLIEYLKKENYQDLINEYLDPPTEEVISFSNDFSKLMDQSKINPPDRITPNCEGGLLFECYKTNFVLKEHPSLYEQYEITKDLIIEYSRFIDSRRDLKIRGSLKEFTDNIGIIKKLCCVVL